MKATGIVRKIDDLGRIVIPKEIRRTLHIKNGGSLEIFTDREGSIIFKKYSPIIGFLPFAAQYAKVLSNAVEMPIIICDTDSVIAVSELPENEYVDRKITSKLGSIIFEREKFILSEDNLTPLRIIVEIESNSAIVIPIVTSREAVGAVVAVAAVPNTFPTSAQILLVETVAKILSKQVEN